MHAMIVALALVAASATTVGAQQIDHSKHMQQMQHGMQGHEMTTACPLHLTTLNLSAAQQVVYDSLRAEHQAAMKTLVAKYQDARAGDTKVPMSAEDHAAMEKGMAAAIAAVQTILTPSQRATFDAAVASHEAEMKAMQEKGDHDCIECCTHCLDDDHMHQMMMKKPE